MIEAIGIFIGKKEIYISGITTEDAMSYISYYKILTFSNKSQIVSRLNEWYTREMDKLNNVPISINLPSHPILRVVEYEENEAVSINKRVSWEIQNFLLNEEDFTYCYDVVGESLVLAFAEKDEILDFVNSLNFTIANLENSISGLTNILTSSHEVSNSVVIFAEKDCLTMVTTVSGIIKDFKIVHDSTNSALDTQEYIAGVRDRYTLENLDIFVSGLTETTELLSSSISDYEVKKINPFMTIGQTENIIKNSRISDEGVMLPISLGFAVNCLSEKV